MPITCKSNYINFDFGYGFVKNCSDNGVFILVAKQSESETTESLVLH